MKEISSDGVDYALLTKAPGRTLIGIEIICNGQSLPETQGIIKKFPESVKDRAGRVAFGEKGIIIKTSDEMMELPLGKDEIRDLQFLFLKGKTEKNLAVARIIGTNPGLQLIIQL